MLKRLAFVMTVGLVVGVAYGAPTRITSFQVFSGESPTASGMAILNFSSGQNRITAQVILSDLVGSAEYAVILRVPGTWCLDETTAIFPIAVFQAESPGEFFFPIDAVNQFASPVGNLTFHGMTTSGSGDFSNSDVIVVLQSDWDNPIEFSSSTLRVRARLAGTSTVINACPLVAP